ncbi:MAG: adenylosuccinate synthetase [Clostridia bacterium]|nr:adenylosuccinate synthetase [Clostridia bacterium]
MVFPKMSVHIVIGKNFGDEGKGLATDYFAAQSEKQGHKCLVIRHNGGGQAGHTVDLPARRFVFHQLSAGSFRNAHTYWSKSFLPDLYKLREEADEFAALHGTTPSVYGHPLCRCVYIDDVLVNMALESSRGKDRHGSCGMGINEAVTRSAFSDACLHLHEVKTMTTRELYDKLLHIRMTYLPRRLQELGLHLEQTGEYGELLANNNVLYNAAQQMHLSSQAVTLASEDIVRNYDNIVFEGAQGLLLDENYLLYAPHLTSSRTGLDNPVHFIRTHLPDTIPEVVYVTRSYITRHGAGPLPYEDCWNKQNYFVADHTNLTNPWQGKLRFAPHGTKEEFFAAMHSDLQKHTHPVAVSCMVTHLNETDEMICSTSGNVSPSQWFCGACVPSQLNYIYLSSTPYTKDIRKMEIEKQSDRT